MFDFNDKTGEIFAYGVIGEEITADAVRKAVKAIGNKRITLRLNTPGGSIDEGVAIFNMLRNLKPGVTTIVDSLAASMGGYLFMAGDERLVYPNSMTMIHNPWTVAFGDAGELRHTAEVLDKYKGTIVDLMASVTGKDPQQISDDLDAETWLAGEEVVGYGLATKLIGGKESTLKPVTSRLDTIAAKSLREGRLPAALGGKGKEAKSATPRRDEAIRKWNEMKAKWGWSEPDTPSKTPRLDRVKRLIEQERKAVESQNSDEGGLFVNAEAGEMFLYGPIDRGRAAIMVKAFAAGGGGKEWTVRISSGGGLAAEAMEMADAIKRHTSVVTTIAGHAASAAMVVFMAADVRLVSEQCNLMIHEVSRPCPHGVDPERNEELCRQASDGLAERLAKQLNRPYPEVRQWVANETWFNAKDAVRLGFAHGIDDAPETAKAKKGAPLRDYYTAKLAEWQEERQQRDEGTEVIRAFAAIRKAREQREKVAAQKRAAEAAAWLRDRGYDDDEPDPVARSGSSYMWSPLSR